MMVILLFTPCAKDKIVFADLIFFICGFFIQKKNPYHKDFATGQHKNIVIKRITYIMI